MSATAPEVAGYPWRDVVELIEVETAFGTVAAGEQALVDAIKELFRSERAERAGEAPEDPDHAVQA